MKSPGQKLPLPRNRSIMTNSSEGAEFFHVKAQGSGGYLSGMNRLTVCFSRVKVAGVGDRRSSRFD